MGFYSNKQVLVTGGTGMIGHQLVKLLLEAGASVRIAALDDSSRAPQGAEYNNTDLRDFQQCLDAVSGCEIVFHLAGVKGSPAMTAERPASFFVPTLSFNTNTMEAARRQGVERYLFTSSIGVYAPSEIFSEDDVWSTFPSPNDRFAGWAKRMGELQAEAYAIEYGWKDIAIVRPANVYGPYDNFDPKNAMVIPSLIYRALSGENPLAVWGDGAAIRDFIHARDAAAGMMRVVELGINEPVNLGTGRGMSIRDIVNIIADEIDGLEIVWDTEKPSGDARRIMDTRRAEGYGIKPATDIRGGIRETIAWYREHKNIVDRRYNVFTESNYLRQMTPTKPTT